MSYTYDYPRPSVTADCVVIKVDGNQLQILLIQRQGDPYQGYWAIPGGFLEMEEELEEAASRELKEETGLIIAHHEQIGTFGQVGRDPRGRVISVAYVGFIDGHQEAQASSDAAQVKWFVLEELPRLAFDHEEIIKKALAHVRNRLLTAIDNAPPFGLSPNLLHSVSMAIQNNQQQD